MPYTLNIGLKPSEESSRRAAISRQEVLAAVRGAGFRVLAYHQAVSHTEPTAVVVVDRGVNQFLSQSCHNISVALSQDCIAVLSSDTGAGYLIGPRAEKWGEFNPDYFITEEQAEEQAYAGWTSIAA